VIGSGYPIWHHHIWVLWEELLASSVDAERAFPDGRLQVNHLQHGISSQSFKALVTLESWYNTPLMDKDLKLATAVVGAQTDRKGKQEPEGIIEIAE